MKAKLSDEQSLPLWSTPRDIREKVLGISELKMYELLAREDVPKIKVGRKYLIPTKKFLEWLEGQAGKN